jgi:hypothetical protein
LEEGAFQQLIYNNAEPRLRIDFWLVELNFNLFLCCYLTLTSLLFSHIILYVPALSAPLSAQTIKNEKRTYMSVKQQDVMQNSCSVSAFNSVCCASAPLVEKLAGVNRQTQKRLHDSRDNETSQLVRLAALTFLLQEVLVYEFRLEFLP